MNYFSATITGVSIVLVECNDAGLVCWTIGEESRPATLADADTFLAFHGYGRTAPWELDDNGGVTAPVKQIDNLFNGTRAARLEQSVGTTHEAWDYDQARNVENGDLVSDGELSALYVAAATNTEGGRTLIQQVAEGKVWDDRFAGWFMPGQLVKRARRKS